MRTILQTRGSPIVEPSPQALLSDPARHTEGLLALVLRLMAAGEPRLALRYADRARRMRPGDVALTQLCARIWAQNGRPDLGLALMDGLAPDGHWAPWALTRTELLLGAGRPDDAADALEGLAGLFAMEALPGFAQLAGTVCAASEGRRDGWLALSASGTLTGGAPSGLLNRLADIVGTQGGRWSEPGYPAGVKPSGGLTAFHVSGLQSLQAIAGALAETATLIGARSLRWPPAWRFEGALTFDGDRLVGSVGLGWAPSHPLPVILAHAAGHETQILTDVETGANGDVRHVFSIPRDPEWRADSLAAFALLPDGRRARLEHGPAPGLRKSERPPRHETAPPPGYPHRVSVIVPVYAGMEETLGCLKSVLENTPLDQIEIIAVYDQGPEPQLLEALRRLARDGQITLLINPRNLGFPASVNRGMAERPGADVVLLNADAEVFGDWLARLRATAYARSDIATVTPFSNAGSIMSYPGGADTACDQPTAARRDRLLAGNPDRTLIDLPSAVGFCMYIKRACLTEIGDFDDEAFGRGYGEENDFCLRARAAGWRHVAATDLFVRHAGGRSFGPLKSLLMETNLRVLSRRHPGYADLVGAFLRQDPLHPTRLWMDERRLADDPRRAVLMISLGRDGGVTRHLKDRHSDLLASGVRVLELTPVVEDADGGLCRLSVVGEAFGDLTYRLPSDLERLAQTLRPLPIENIQIHHFVGLDPGVLDLPARLGLPFEVIVHDYSWVCPRITFIAGDSRYCGEPALEVCERCVVEHGSLIGDGISVAALRSRTARLFERAAMVTVSCQDVSARLRRYVPDLAPRIMPWEPPSPPPALSRHARPGQTRVAVIGAIGEHKGYHHLLDCARDAAARKLDLEFIVVGYTEDDFALFETGKVFVTGAFKEDEVADLLERERCNVALYLSVAPETWSYALSHGIRSGLPIVAFNFGALGERLRTLARARLLPTDAGAASVNDALITSARCRLTLFLRATGQAPMEFEGDVWARAPGEGAWVEGFRIDLADIGYRGIFPQGVQTPWTLWPDWSQDPSGSRPLLGVALRLKGGLAATHRVEYAATFSSGEMATAIGEGEPCLSPHQNDPLVALRVTLSPRRARPEKA